MSGRNPAVFKASGIYLRVWESHPLAAFASVDVRRMLEYHGLSVRRETLPRRMPSMLMRCGKSRIEVVVDPRCSADAQDFYAAVEFCAWIEGADVPGDEHRIAAAGLMLPALGVARLQRALADDDPVLAFGRLPELMKWAAYARHDAARRQSAELCLMRARTARSEHRRAEAVGWYTRVHTAPGVDAEMRARAYGGAGVTQLAHGYLEESYQLLLRGYEYARQNGVKLQVAMHCHDLYSVCYALKRWDEAEKWAGKAARLYPRGHPKLQQLASDVATLWSAQGYHLRVLRVCEGLVAATSDPTLRSSASANAANAAAALGLISRFLDHAGRALPGEHEQVALAVRGAVMTTLAEAAVVVEMWDLAGQLVKGCRGIVDPSGDVQLNEQLTMVEVKIESRGERLARTLLYRVRALAA